MWDNHFLSIGFSLDISSSAFESITSSPSDICYWWCPSVPHLEGYIYFTLIPWKTFSFSFCLSLSVVSPQSCLGFNMPLGSNDSQYWSILKNPQSHSLKVVSPQRSPLCLSQPPANARWNLSFSPSCLLAFASPTTLFFCGLFFFLTF